MKELIEWIDSHWLTLATSLGIGSSSGILGKKFIDREQNKKLKELKEQVDMQETRIKTSEDNYKDLSHKLDTNTLLDKELRETLKTRDEQIHQQLAEVKEGHKMIYNHLLNQTK